MDNNKDNIVEVSVEEKKDEVVIIITNTLDLTAAGEKVIEEKKKSATYRSSYYNHNYTSYNAEIDTRSVYFFEMSNLDSKPLYFHKVSAFVDWCKEHGVFISESKISELKKMPTSYSVCRQGQNTIITRVSKYLLEQAFKDANVSSDYNKATSVGVNKFKREEGSYPYCSPYDEDYYGADWY